MAINPPRKLNSLHASHNLNGAITETRPTTYSNSLEEFIVRFHDRLATHMHHRFQGKLISLLERLLRFHIDNYDL